MGGLDVELRIRGKRLVLVARTERARAFLSGRVADRVRIGRPVGMKTPEGRQLVGQLLEQGYRVRRERDRV
jgi:hypothetical protein